MSTLLPPQDKVAVRVITIGVVVVMVFCAVGVFLLIWNHKDPKDLLPLGTAALGAAVGFLARTSTESGSGAADPPLPVVVTPDQQPIPVDPVDGGGDESGGEPAAARLRTTRKAVRVHD